MYNKNSLIAALMAMAIFAYYFIVGSVQKAVNKGVHKLFISIFVGVIAGIIAYHGLAIVFAGFFGSIAILTTTPATIAAVFFGMSVYMVVFDEI